MKMKNVVNKALVWLLVMSIISSGMGTFLPDAAVLGTMHAAKAESAPIPEAFCLDEQPLGEEQTSGE